MLCNMAPGDGISNLENQALQQGFLWYNFTVPQQKASGSKELNMENVTNALEEMKAEVMQKTSWVHALGFVVESYKGFATKEINGRQVALTLIENCRNSKAKDKPRLQWKVNGKVVKAAEIINSLK